MAHNQRAIGRLFEPALKEATKVGGRAQRIVAGKPGIEPVEPDITSLPRAERGETTNRVALDRRISRSEEIADRANRNRRVGTEAFRCATDDVGDERKGVDMLVTVDEVRRRTYNVYEALDLMFEPRPHIGCGESARQRQKNRFPQRQCGLPEALSQIEVQSGQDAPTMFSKSLTSVYPQR